MHFSLTDDYFLDVNSVIRILNLHNSHVITLSRKNLFCVSYILYI